MKNSSSSDWLIGDRDHKKQEKISASKYLRSHKYMYGESTTTPMSYFSYQFPIYVSKYSPIIPEVPKMSSPRIQAARHSFPALQVSETQRTYTDKE